MAWVRIPRTRIEEYELVTAHGTFQVRRIYKTHQTKERAAFRSIPGAKEYRAFLDGRAIKIAGSLEHCQRVIERRIKK